MAAGFRTASDGYPAREAGPWTEEKLRILECYVRGYVKATARARQRFALDGFAGTGLNYSLTSRTEIPGSPLIALQAGPPHFTKVVANEVDDGAQRALAARCARFGDRADVVGGDVNEIIGELLGRIPRRAPAFAFLDPEGADVAWPTVEAIARHRVGDKKVEQLVLFPVDMGFVRLLSLHQVNEARAERVERIYGHDRFREVWAQRARREISPDEARGHYVTLYGDGFRRLGYDVVLDRQVKTPGGRPLYFLIFASDDKVGQKIMDHCFDRVHVRVEEERGQGTLFDMPAGPRRRRITPR